MVIAGVLLCVLAYIAGSIPFGYWIVLLTKKIDVRNLTFSNIGFAHVWEALGWPIAIPIFLLDLSKGYLPVMFCLKLFGLDWALACMIAAMIGHAFSLYFFVKERVWSGGKSVTVMFGGLLALDIRLALFCALFYVVMLYATEYLSVSAIIVAFMLSLIAILLGDKPFEIFAFVMMSLLVFYTHRRSIGRLLHGVEPKIGHRREGVTVGFAVHSIGVDDLAQSPISAWLAEWYQRKKITKLWVKRMIRKCPVLEAGQITGIETADGQKATVLFFAIPFLPEQIKDPANKLLVETLLKSAAVQAERMGCVILGLGGLLSTVAEEGGRKLQLWARGRGLGVTIDNGGAYTAAATYDALCQVLAELGLKLEDLVVASLGASGYIGGLTLMYIKDKVAKRIAVAREVGKLGELDEEMLKTADYSLLKDADVIISSTSAPGYVITLDNEQYLKRDVVIADVAVPEDMDPEVVGKRDDIHVFKGGVVLLPGYPQSSITLHFDKTIVDGIECDFVPACLAQVVMIALEKAYDRASNKSVRPDDVGYFLRLAARLGLKVFVTKESKAKVFLGESA